MRKRITESDLEHIVNELNHCTNSPLTTYTKKANGEYKANLGNYHLSFAYGGVSLHQIVTEGGGVHAPLIHGHTSKRELHSMLECFLMGLKTK